MKYFQKTQENNQVLCVTKCSASWAAK